MSDRIIITFNFNGDHYVLCRYDDNTILVPIKAICARFKVNVSWQYKRLRQEDSRFDWRMGYMPDEHYIWRNRICLVHTSFSRWFGSVALGKVSAEEQANIALYKTTFQAKLEDLLESLQANKVQAPQQVLPISFSPFFVSGGQVTTPAEPVEVVSSYTADTAEQEVPASAASFDGILHPQKTEAAEPEEPAYGMGLV